MNNLTHKSTTNLCSTCRFNFFREGFNGEIDSICTWHHPSLKIKSNTSSCTGYKHKNEQDIYDLEKMAYIITGNPKSKMGFKHYTELTEEEKETLGL